MTQSKKHDKKNHPDANKDKSVILWIGVVVMMVSTIIIHLFFTHILGFSIDYIISGFWVFSIFPLFIYLMFFMNKNRITLSDIGFRREGLLKASIYGIVFGIIIGLIGWVITYLLGSTVSEVSDDLMRLFVMRSVVFAPIYEEILVRGLLWSALSYTFLIMFKEHNPGFEKKKDIAIIVIISLVFLFFHYGRDTTLFLTKFVFDSFAFSILYYKTKNLMTPILAHSIANLFVLIQSIIL